jgi:hypothetical protein
MEICLLMTRGRPESTRIDCRNETVLASDLAAFRPNIKGVNALHQKCGRAHILSLYGNLTGLAF